jgi:hypothetical protein
MARMKLSSRDQITPETPLRLALAAALAFPDGSMTARRVAARKSGAVVAGSKNFRPPYRHRTTTAAREAAW